MSLNKREEASTPSIKGALSDGEEASSAIHVP